MTESIKHIVYSKNVVEFVTVAREYCYFLENTDTMGMKEFIVKSPKILSLLYLKASVLPEIQPVFEEGNEKFVTEAEWDLIHDKVLRKLGPHDHYIEVFDPRMQEDGEAFTASLAENLTDIYQDLADFLTLYQTGNTDIMNDALWECKLNFDQYWGQSLTNGLGALHRIVSSGVLDEEIDQTNRNHVS